MLPGLIPLQHRRAGGFDGGQRAGHGLKIGSSRLGQRQPMRVAMDQRLAEVLFQARDGTADGALGHAERLRRAREAAERRAAVANACNSDIDGERSRMGQGAGARLG